MTESSEVITAVDGKWKIMGEPGKRDDVFMLFLSANTCFVSPPGRRLCMTDTFFVSPPGRRLCMTFVLYV